MVKYSGLDRVFAALADPTRRAIVDRLTQGAASITELATPFEMSLPAVLKHVAVLEDARLVTTTKHGRTKVATLDAHAMGEALGWIEERKRTWDRRLDRLERHLEKGSKR